MALSSGDVTITTSGVRHISDTVRVRTCKVVIASSGIGASGVPLPATPNDWGLKHRLDNLEIIDQGGGTPQILNIDYAQQTATASSKAVLQVIYGTATAGLATVATGSTLSGTTMYVKAWGY